MDSQRGFVELTGGAAVEVGIFLRRDVRFRAGPERRTVRDLLFLRIRLFLVEDGDGDMARLRRDASLGGERLGLAGGVFLEVQDDAGAACRSLRRVDRLDGERTSTRLNSSH